MNNTLFIESHVHETRTWHNRYLMYKREEKSHVKLPFVEQSKSNSGICLMRMRLIVGRIPFA